MITKLEAITTLIQGLDVEEKKKLLNELDIELNYPQFEEQKKELVRSWGDAYEGGYYVADDSSIEKAPPVCLDDNKDVYRTEKEAIAYGLAAAQLSQIVADANGDWMADWTDEHQFKYGIIGWRLGGLITDILYDRVHPFPMKSKEIAEACLEKHRTLWEQFWMV